MKIDHFDKQKQSVCILALFRVFAKSLFRIFNEIVLNISLTVKKLIEPNFKMTYS